MTPEYKAHLRALIAAATAGPWKSDQCGDIWTVTIPPGETYDENMVATAATVFSGRSDAAFIAESRTALPAALDEVERLDAAFSATVSSYEEILATRREHAARADARFDDLCAERDALRARITRLEEDAGPGGWKSKALEFSVKVLQRDARVAKLEAVVETVLEFASHSTKRNHDVLMAALAALDKEE